jgi:uncharacterized protein YlxW (UPF0749 family)
VDVKRYPRQHAEHHRHRRARSVSSSVAVGLVLAAAGALFATSAGTAAGTDLRADSQDLPGLVRQETARLDERNAVVGDLRSEVERLSGIFGDEETIALREQAAELSGPAQMEAVTGPGLTVTLDDAPFDRVLPPELDPNVLVVHQQDLQAVVNAMWASGAEAMMLMDQRVISTSAVRCVGNTLHLQGRVYSPPYRIAAIGDPERLQDGLDNSPELEIYQQHVRRFGLAYDVEEHDELEMPAYEGSLDLQHARSPDRDADGSDPADETGTP